MSDGRRDYPLGPWQGFPDRWLNVRTYHMYTYVLTVLYCDSCHAYQKLALQHDCTLLYSTMYLEQYYTYIHNVPMYLEQYYYTYIHNTYSSMILHTCIVSSTVDETNTYIHLALYSTLLYSTMYLEQYYT